jgi:P-type Mg2+ transporter
MLCEELHCNCDGLSTQDAEARLCRYGPNADAAAKRANFVGAIARRLLEPLSLILLAAGVVSAVTGDTIGGSIIVTILAFSIGLDTIQEGHAVKAAEVLRRSVAIKAEVKRDGTFRSVPVGRWFREMSCASGPVISSLPTRFCWKAKRLRRVKRP